MKRLGLNDFRCNLILAIVCVICYGNTVFNDYSFDDNIAITSNIHIPKGIRGIPGLLVSPYREIGDMKMEYRPLTGVTFAIEHEFFGGNPHVSHAVSVMLYVVLALVVFLAMKEVFGLAAMHPALPLLITLFYIVHPSQTETVASLKNREQILSMLFAVSAMIYSDRFFMQPQRKIRNGAAALLMMGFSYLSKMVLSIPFAGIIALVWLFKKKRKPDAAFLIFFALLALLTAAVIYKNAMISTRPVTFIENPLANNQDLLLLGGFVFKTLWFYLRFMVFPYPFSFFYGYNMIPLEPLNIPLVGISLIVHLGVFVLGARWFIRGKTAGLFLLCYLFNISFYSNIYPVPGIVAERILFSASLWFIAAAIVLVFQFLGFSGNSSPAAISAGGKIRGGAAFKKTLGRMLPAAAAVVFMACCVLTVHRNFQWKNVETLMRADIGHLSNSALANYLYAKLLFFDSQNSAPENKKNLLDLSKKHFRQVTRVMPQHGDSYFRLGMIYEYDENNRDSAFFFFKKAYDLEPNSNTSRYELGKQYYLNGNLPEAEQLFSSVYRELPRDTLTLFFYAQVLFNLGKISDALLINGELMKLAPGTYYPYYNYGIIYYSDSTDKSIGYLEKTMQLGYKDDQIRNILLNYYLSNGMEEKVRQLSFE